MAQLSFIHTEIPGRPIPAVTIRYVNGEYVTKLYDPEDETEQVYRPSPMELTWEHSA